MDGKRMIIVLGMHRSGTSALCKGLETLGVDLGADFHPTVDDNPKGYWEDRKFHGLNEAMLAESGSAWDDLRLIAPERLKQLEEGPFFERAVAVVQEHMAGKTVAGIKDPRFCRFLPFWKKVFAAAGCEASYVVSLRNPLSVAESLRRRDGFSEVKSLWLWVLHNVLVAAAISGERQVFVDYDELLGDPAGQLRRAGRFLELTPDPAALAAYAEEFLDPGLRHARFSDDELRERVQGAPLVGEIYEEFRSRARADAASAPFEEGLVARWLDGWANAEGLLRAHEGLGARNDELRAEIEGLQARAGSLEGRISALEAEVAQKRDKLAAAEFELTLAKSSLSWKITKPLRALRDLLP